MNNLLETQTDPDANENFLDGDQDMDPIAENDPQDSGDEGTPEESPQDQSYTLADILTKAEISEDDFHTVPLTFKANGEEITVPVKEVLDGYRRDSDYRQKTQSLAQDRKTVENQVAQVLQARAQELEHNDKLIAQLETLVAGDMNTPEMQALMVQNPQMWQQYNLRHQQGKQAFAEMREKLQQEASQLQQQQAQTVQAQLAQEQNALYQAVPDWDASRSQEVVSYLGSLGFSSEEIGSVVDHRLVILADKARQFDAALKTQKSKPAPKVKTPVPKNRGTRTRANGALDRLARTGNVDDAASVLEQMM